MTDQPKTIFALLGFGLLALVIWLVFALQEPQEPKFVSCNFLLPSDRIVIYFRDHDATSTPQEWKKECEDWKQKNEAKFLSSDALYQTKRLAQEAKEDAKKQALFRAWCESANSKSFEEFKKCRE